MGNFYISYVIKYTPIQTHITKFIQDISYFLSQHFRIKVSMTNKICQHTQLNLFLQEVEINYKKLSLEVYKKRGTKKKLFLRMYTILIKRMNTRLSLKKKTIFFRK